MYSAISNFPAAIRPLGTITPKPTRTARARLARSASGLALACLLGGFGVMAGASTANAAIMDYMITLDQLNNSGVTGGGTLSFNDITNILMVDYTVTGLQDGVHPQHIHGLFDGSIGMPGGTAAPSQTPTIANDTDGDGIIEVLEAAPAYGDILLSLTNTPGAGDFPTTMGGTLHYQQSFNLADPNVFLPASIATGNVYSMADLFPLQDREIVIHGGFLAAGVGAGTPGEADGTAGYKAVLPVATGLIRQVAVPEPASFAVLLAGVVGLVAARRKHRGRTMMAAG